MGGFPEGKAVGVTAVPVANRSSSRFRQRVLFAAQVLLLFGVLWQLAMLYKSYCFAAAAAAIGVVDGNVLRRQSASSAGSSSSNLPDYYVTKPELLPGPTPTGVPAFLAETNPAPFPGTTYVAPSPLETQVPIVGQVGDDESIYHFHGQLSHYFSNPTGFGVDEYSLPANASIAQLHMLHRHGSRYPTKGAGIETLAAKIKNYTTGVLGDVTFEGQLSFLNGWKYKLGEEILVPVGKQELFDSGTLHQYLYGHLNPTNGTKIIARSTTQDRMLNSAEYFLAGFYGLGWTENATLVLARENLTGIFNNTLAGYQNCNNSNLAVNQGGNNASLLWEAKYLANATTRLHADAPGFNWTVADSYNAQSMCAYETVALGYSAFCGLFTYEEWEGYEYSVDIQFAGGYGFQSPTARGTGVGYVAEIVARLEHHLITSAFAQTNTTLDSNPATFPLNQTLNFDFSHDTNIMSILTAFGLKQFDTYLPPDHILRNRSLIVSHMEPFAARLDMEIIDTPSPLSGDRPNGPCYEEGKPTKYIHFILNQRTVPLGKSIPTCGDRHDGWCELETFLAAQKENLKIAEYEYSCFGKYAVVPYGTLTNGVPLPA